MYNYTFIALDTKNNSFVSPIGVLRCNKSLNPITQIDLNCIQLPETVRRFCVFFKCNSRTHSVCKAGQKFQIRHILTDKYSYYYLHGTRPMKKKREFPNSEKFEEFLICTTIIFSSGGNYRNRNHVFINISQR